MKRTKGTSTSGLGESNLTIISVWAQILTSLGSIRSIFADNEAVAAGLRKFTLQLVAPAVEEIGWDFDAGESYLRGQLRALLISVAGNAGHEK